MFLFNCPFAEKFKKKGNLSQCKNRENQSWRRREVIFLILWDSSFFFFSSLSAREWLNFNTPCRLCLTCKVLCTSWLIFTPASFIAPSLLYLYFASCFSRFLIPACNDSLRFIASNWILIQAQVAIKYYWRSITTDRRVIKGKWERTYNQTYILSLQLPNFRINFPNLGKIEMEKISHL